VEFIEIEDGPFYARAVRNGRALFPVLRRHLTPENCRFAQQVAEQALGDIAAGQRVRVKTRAFPDRLFHGIVSRIGGDSELDPAGQRSYRVELTIENEDGLLRPGMTVFSRIDFGRRAVAWLVAHKLKQALRPELWML
jgi:hypothetical protein